MDELRLFVALELPDRAIRDLENVQDRLRQVDAEDIIRWSSGDGFHLTLKFMGDAPEDELPEIYAALGNAITASKSAPFSLIAEGIGGFPDIFTPRTVWAGVAGELDKLLPLQMLIEKAIAPLRLPVDNKAFSPHLTLGRMYPKVAKDKISAFGYRLSELDIGKISQWPVEAVSLMHSELQRRGPVYHEVATWRLTDPTTIS
jgi:2'-5' RNA ligase